MQKARDRALALVGQGYIYGARGQTCSPAFRRQQAAQYPDQANYILDVGAKWDGRPVWDCAQLTRTVAAAAGVTLPSGATSQWNKGPWKQKGTIDTLPKGTVVFLYRRQNGSTTVMAHTGVYMGDGTCVHARGTAYGVVHQDMAQQAWTHWASPWDGSTEPKEDTMDYTNKICRVIGGRLALRQEGRTTAPLMFYMPVDTLVTVLEHSGDWCRVRYDKDSGSYMGWCMAAYLDYVQDMPPDEATPDDDVVTVAIPRDIAVQLLEALDRATAQG